MSFGNLMGGVYQGGIGVWGMMQNDDKLRVEREKADRESYEFDKVKKRDVALDSADTEYKDTAEAAAQAKSLAEGEAARALTEQALKENTDAITKNQPIETGETQTVAPTEEQKAGIAAAYEGYGKTADGVVEGALAKERNSGSIVTAERQAEIVKKFGGIQPDEVNRYRLNMAKSDAFMSTHPELSVKLKKEAEEDLAGNLLSAAMTGDNRKVVMLNNASPSGYKIRSFGTDLEKGVVGFTTESGEQKTMPLEKFFAGVLSKTDPKAAATMLTTLRQQDMVANSKGDAMQNALMIALMKMADKNSGGVGAGGAKKPSGHGVVNGVAEGDIGREDYFKQFGVSGESGSPEARTQASAGYGFYQMMLKNDPSIGEHEAFRLSQNVAMGKAELLPNFDETTFSWRRGIKTETGNFHWVDAPGNNPQAIGVDPKRQLEREMQSPFAKEVMDDAKWANFEKAYATARQSGNKQQIAELGNVILFGQRVRGAQKKPAASKPENSPAQPVPDRMINLPGRLISSAIGGIKDEAAQVVSNAAQDVRRRMTPSITLGQELNTPIDSVIKR